MINGDVLDDDGIGEFDSEEPVCSVNRPAVLLLHTR